MISPLIMHTTTTDNQEYNDVINTLQDYMLITSNVIKIIENVLRPCIEKKRYTPLPPPINNTCKKMVVSHYKTPVNYYEETHHTHITNTSTNVKKLFFLPNQKDSLFWCFYYMKYNILPTTINVVVEKNIKIEYVVKLRNIKDSLKKHKLPPLIDIENQLTNEKTINLSTFFALCILENINILYATSKTYFEMILNENDTTHMIVFNHLKYEYHGNDTSTIDDVKNKLLKIQHINKPLYAVSHYKGNELVEICSKLGIDIIDPNTKKQKLKNTLYELIVQAITI
jgi:hypothetical protein